MRRKGAQSFGELYRASIEVAKSEEEGEEEKGKGKGKKGKK